MLYRLSQNLSKNEIFEHPMFKKQLYVNCWEPRGASIENYQLWEWIHAEGLFKLMQTFQNKRLTDYSSCDELSKVKTKNESDSKCRPTVINQYLTNMTSAWCY